MLDEDQPSFPNWDQDATAIEGDYGAQDPVAVMSDLLEAARTVAVTYEHVPPDAWSRRGMRSNGSDFTVASIAIHHLHDIVYHAHDVDHG